MMSEEKVKDNHSLYLYLTSSMLRKPKFNKVSCWKFCKWKMSSDRSKKLKLKRFSKGKDKLVKDLDIKTYLSTQYQVKGLIMTTLDDKQRLMLKYQNHRVIEAFSSDSEEEENDSQDSEPRERKPVQMTDNEAIMSK